VTLALVGAAAVALLMLALWAIHFPLHNAAIVDAGWAGGLALLGAIDAIGGEGWVIRRAIVGAMAALWGLRLAIHLLRDRIIGHPEEGRYVELRRKWRSHLGLKFLAFFEFQALLCVVLSAPFFLAAADRSPGLGWLELAGIVVWCIGMVGESIADSQLKTFKQDRANQGRTCRGGLWRYSRHPNYFFEWTLWLGFGMVSLAAPNGWIGLLSPALILYFLLGLTGIPATEEQALRTRGDDYRDYQRTTSAFIPWFPKRVTERS
jgi:steroid 5-alpha reductase family enzyme